MDSLVHVFRFRNLAFAIKRVKKKKKKKHAAKSRLLSDHQSKQANVTKVDYNWTLSNTIWSDCANRQSDLGLRC